jgi:hypothetical protein
VDPQLTFASAAEAERHFREQHLPELVQKVTETTFDGVSSRRMADRGLQRAIEDAWVRETRSPSQMMQELAGRIREAGMHIFRHRRGMLFVSPIRVRSFAHGSAAVSAMVSAIFEALIATPRMNRKQLAEKLIADVSAGEAENKKLALTSDLHWLISEGYVIEFNDGSLDLPRAKQTKPEVKTEEVSVAAVETAPVTETNVETIGSTESRPTE